MKNPHPLAAFDLFFKTLDENTWLDSPPVSPIKEAWNGHDAVDAPICKQVDLIFFFHCCFWLNLHFHFMSMFLSYLFV